MDNLPLVVLTPGFPANDEDSTCLPAQQAMMLSIAEQYPERLIIILSFQYPFTSVPYYWNKMQVIPFNGQNRGRLHRLMLWFKVWRQLNILLKKNGKFALLAFWYAEAGMIGTLFSRRNKLPFKCWLLGQDARPGNKFVSWVKPRENELVAMSDFLSSQFFKNYRIRPAHVVPNAILSSVVIPSQSLNRRDIDILAVGSLIPLKNYQLLLDLIASLKQQHPNISAAICGDGPERKLLQAKAESLGIKNEIQFLGELPHPRVLKLMGRAKLFIHPSSYEGFSGACLEALSAGTPVISFCKPMDATISKWCIVKTLDEMKEAAEKILQCPSPDFTPVIPFSMKDSARTMLTLLRQ